MESDATNVRSSAYWHTEGLNGPIQVHVIERILIVPDPRRRVRHFIAHKPNPIVTWSGLDLVYCCSSSRPGDDRRLHTHGGPVGEKEKDVGPPLTENGR